MTKKNIPCAYRAIIVGGGLSGLAAAYLLQEDAAVKGIPLEITLIEAEERLGGKIGTLYEQGYACEIGPNGFLDNKPFTLDLCRKMGIEERLLRSNDSARKRFIFSKGVLQSLPEDPVSFALSDLISIGGKVRIAAEYLVPQKKKEGGDETLAEFVRRRLGQEALDTLIDPMASGIFAGDPENMSLAACFPKIVALEENFGGLVKGMLAMKKQAEAAGRKGPDSAGPGGVLMSFRKGLEELIVSLAERLKGTVLKGSRVLSMDERSGPGRHEWEVRYQSGQEVETKTADVVILAVPAYDFGTIIHDMDKALASTMNTIPYAAMGVVHLGFREQELPRPLDGFGFLVPHKERRRIIGSLWASSIFAGRAPEEHVLMTVMIGGAKDPKTPRLAEEELVATACEELEFTMGITVPPSFSRVLKWECAIPQYTFGHLDRVTSVEKRLEDHPGIFLTGNAFRGVGVNDCVSSGMKASEQACEYLEAQRLRGD